MKLQAPYKCDYCTQLKGETNHWWLLIASPVSFILEPWDDTSADVESVKHICSERCAGVALSKYMSETPAVPSELAAAVKEFLNTRVPVEPQPPIPSDDDPLF